MKHTGHTFLNHAQWLAVCALLSPLVVYAEKVTLDLSDGDIAIVVPAIPTQKYYPDNFYQRIKIYTNKKTTNLSPCGLCTDTVANCTMNESAYCKGSINVVFRSVLPISIVDTRDKHSPDTCYRQFCWSGGSCQTVSYQC